MDLAPFVAKAITPRVHVLMTPQDYLGVAIGNVTLIEQSDGFVLIDSGMTASHGRTIVAYARSLSSKPIKAVALTHWHSDHPGGVSGVRDAYPRVRIISTRATEGMILNPISSFDIGYAPNPRADSATAERWGETIAQYRKLLDDPSTDAARRQRINKAIDDLNAYIKAFPGSYIVPPTETFERQLLLDDRELPVRLMFLGLANTDGDLVAWLPKQRIVATGDIVVSPYPFGFGSYPGDWIETIGKIKALGFTTLIPGHGEPRTDSTYLDKLVAAMSDIRAQVGPLARQGLSLEEVRKKADFKSGELFGTSARDKANFQGLFADPMTDSAYKEALGQPIVQGAGPAGSPKPRFTETPPKSRSKKHKS